MLPSEARLPGTPAPRSDVHGRQIAALLLMQHRPGAYTQRLTERLSFVGSGGQHWMRELQVLIPPSPPLPDGDHSPRSDDRTRFIVSLGMFKRKRFADFAVRNAAGHRLALLTRDQHGDCLSAALLVKHLSWSEIERLDDSRASSAAAENWAAVWRAVVEMFTSVDRRSPADPAAGADIRARAAESGRFLSAALADLGVSATVVRDRVARFVEEFGALSSVTQYLCWVDACPGDLVSLTASYTMSDPLRLRAQAPNITDVSRRGPVRRSALYARCGLAPINYELVTPAHDHTRSYYFTIEPPADTEILYVDWGLGNSMEPEQAEVDCAYHSIHVHQGPPATGRPADSEGGRISMPGSLVYAYLRTSTRDHLPIILGAALNLVLAWVAQGGELAKQGLGGATTVLLVMPTALLAFIAQQRRHYFAAATRWFLWLLGLYLLVNVFFVVSVRYSVVSTGLWLGRPQLLDDLVSGAMFLGSGLVIAWLLAIVSMPATIRRQLRRQARWGTPSGWLGQALRLRLALRDRGRWPGWVDAHARRLQRQLRRVRREQAIEASVHRFARLVTRLGDRLVLAFAVLFIGAVAALTLLGWGEGRADVERARTTLSAPRP